MSLKRSPRMAKVLAGAISLPVLLLAGCGGMTTTDMSAPLAGSATLTGHLMGGNQPVSGATVRLYSAGTTAYGSAGTLYATTTSANDGYGSFSFTKSSTNTGVTGSGTSTYGCPTTGDPQMYLIAQGGSTQGTGNGANSAAAFIAALGKCSTITSATFVDLTETTSVATLAALQQYFNPLTDSLGYPATTQGTLGYANALTTIPNLVNVSTGAALATSSVSATPVGASSAVAVTITAEQAKLNTIANIAAACVNTTSNTSNECTTLFANAYPPVPANTSQPARTFVTASDVLQATYYMLTNPGSQSTQGTNNPTAMANLFGLVSAQSPFQPSLSAGPTDWTLGIRYSSSSACTSGTFLTGPYDLAVDAAGSVWVAASSTTTGNLIQLLPGGTPGSCVLSGSVVGAKGLAIDTANNVWIAGNSAGAPFYKYSITGATSTTFPTSSSAVVPYAVTADGSGNVFFTDTASKTVSEFVNGATSTVAVAPVTVGTVSTYPYFLAVDTTGTLIVPNSTTTNVLYDIYPSTATGNTNGYMTSTIGTASNVVNPYAVAAGLAGRFYLGNSASASNSVSQTAYYLTQTAGAATFSTNTAQYSGGTGSTRGPNAVDGAGNVWYANSLASTGNYVSGATTSYYTVSEFTSSLVPLSPSGQTGGFQKDSTIYNSAPRALAIDLSGNVWGGSNSTTGNGLFEIVGAAVPVVTPIASSLAVSIAAGSTDAVSKP